MRKFNFATVIILASLAFNSCEDALDLLSDDPRDAFVGDWSVNENTARKSSLIFYEVSISKSATDSTLVLINNFYDIGHNLSIEAEVSGSKITVPAQTRDGFTFKGSGTIAYNDKTIDWSYTVDYNNGSAIEHLTATYTKK